MIFTDGINGQLSNQDIANAAVAVLMREKLPVSFHGQVCTCGQHDDSCMFYVKCFFFFQVSTFVTDIYQNSLKIMLKSIGHQAMGLPEHLHGLFVRY